jgi:Flp pilus assembly protein TadD
MQILVRVAAVLALALPLGAASAPNAPSANPPKPGAPTAAAADLDALFARLKTTKNPVEADYAQTMILAIWAKSPSDTANLLYSRGLAAFAGGDKQLAFDLFTAVTSLQPDFAEAWHELGTVNLELNAHDEAMVDFEHTLELEPRHFGAMMKLAMIFESYGNKRAALAALRRAYAVNPHIDGLEARINAMAREVEGQGI